MNQNLRTILDELYALDASLRAEEQKLIPLLEQLMAHKPSAQPDEAFVRKLRMVLREKVEGNTIRNSKNYQLSIIPAFVRLGGLRRAGNYQFIYGLTGIFVGVLLTAPVMYGIMTSNGTSTLSVNEAKHSNAFSYAMKDSGPKAFGDFSGVTEPASPGGRNQSGGGGGTAAGIAAETQIAPAMPPSNRTTDKMMPMEYADYRLKFEGTLPALSDDTVRIYKRARESNGNEANAILSSFAIGTIDLESFKGMKTDMMSFYQDTPYGYVMNVSLKEGSVSINANWERWPHPEASCATEACYQQLRLTVANVLPDDALIEIADQFLAEHRVDLSQYGKPEVDHSWKINYGGDTVYVPESLNVLYPQLIDGKPVYDEGGGKTGMNVSVNIRAKKVSDLWGIIDRTFATSEYPAVKNPSDILQFLEQSGRMNTQWIEPGSKIKTTDITLGTPEMGLMQFYRFEKGSSEEFIVPALIFPVENVPDTQYYYRKTIAVPLAADILKRMTEQQNPMPMPTDDIRVK